MELERDGEKSVAGRFFVKQDHQGPPGVTHGGIVATALDEAMALLIHHAGIHALTASLTIDLRAPAPVGAFVDLAARVEQTVGRRFDMEATASGAEGTIATARGVFIEIER